MLYLIGLGLFDEKDIALRGIQAAKQCDKIYLEMYTNNWQGTLSNLEALLVKEIITLTREEVESYKLVEEAKEHDVALLVPGDPLAATTHFQLIIDCKENLVDCIVIHASSIMTAVAETGLQLYKFGRATTLLHKGDFAPSSPLEIIEKNMANGFHTLVLLDIGMHVKDAIEILRMITEKKIVVCSALGSSRQKIRYGFMEELLDEKFDTPSVIIVPGTLNFKEEEALKLWM